MAGAAADDLGIQSGGWTITWQGSAGDITPGTTILQGIQKTVGSSTTVQYDPRGNFPGTDQADACIVAVGEQPYAEGVGDKADLSLSASDIQLTVDLRPRCGKLVVLLVSGRPMVVTDQLAGWDAFVAAWLPGTEGEGVAEVLFGSRPFTGKLILHLAAQQCPAALRLCQPAHRRYRPALPVRLWVDNEGKSALPPCLGARPCPPHFRS